MNAPNLSYEKGIWKSLFRQTVRSYFKYIIVFILNILLVLMVVFWLDILIILKPNVKLWQVVLLALINVGELICIYLSFFQLHRYLVMKIITQAGNTILIQKIYPLVDQVVLKVNNSLAKKEIHLNEVEIRSKLLQTVKQEHVSRGLRILQTFLFKRVNLKKLNWSDNTSHVSNSLKGRMMQVLITFSLRSKRFVYVLFGFHWLFVLVLVVILCILH